MYKNADIVFRKKRRQTTPFNCSLRRGFPQLKKNRAHVHTLQVPITHTRTLAHTRACARPRRKFNTISYCKVRSVRGCNGDLFLQSIRTGKSLVLLAVWTWPKATSPFYTRRTHKHTYTHTHTCFTRI